MKKPENGKLLRIFIGESDQWHSQPLYEAIVVKAKKSGLAGATVSRCPMGYGAQSRLQANSIMRISRDASIIVEIVDSEERINAFLPQIDTMVTEGLVTIENIQIIKYRKV